MVPVQKTLYGSPYAYTEYRRKALTNHAEQIWSRSNKRGWLVVTETLLKQKPFKAHP